MITVDLRKQVTQGALTTNQISQILVSTKKIVFDIKAFGQFSG